jgi:hypothetical protein
MTQGWVDLAVTRDIRETAMGRAIALEHANHLAGQFGEMVVDENPVIMSSDRKFEWLRYWTAPAAGVDYAASDGRDGEVDQRRSQPGADSL